MTVWNNRNYCIEQLKGRDLSAFDIYEFGIYTGNSFRQIYEAMQECKVRPAKVWGFDSFEGLPAEAPGVPLTLENTAPCQSVKWFEFHM